MSDDQKTKPMMMSELKDGVYTNDEALLHSSADPGKDPGVPYMVRDEDGALKHLTEIFSARIWANEFMKTYKMLFEQEKEIDAELLVSWFANAIMAGHDIGRRLYKEALPEPILKVIDWLDEVPPEVWPFCSSLGCTNRVNMGKSENLCWPHWEIQTRKKVMELAASMCGNPDPAEGCRQIIKLFKDFETQVEDKMGDENATEDSN